MKNNLIILIFTLFSLKSGAVTPYDKTLQEKMEKMIAQSSISKKHLSLYAATVHGEEVFSLNSNQKMIPASITKLITAAAVLHTFKPDHEFKTQILFEGEITDGAVKGPIYLKGGGDPAFVSEKMWMLVNDFLRSGIKKINGGIIVDESIFDDEKFDKGRESVRNDRAYDAPLSGLSFNWNSTTIYIRPGNKKGDKAHVWMDPENEYIQLTSNVTTTEKTTSLNAEKDFSNGHDVFTVTGKIAVGSPEKHIYKNISEPALYAGYNLKSFLKQRGIEVLGGISKAKTPGTAKLASEVASDRLYQILTGMNKFSNNFVAEMLTKAMAYELTNKQGTMDVGLAKIRDFLNEQIGFSKDDYNLVNVSGFTRANKFSSRQYVDLLTWVDSEFSLSSEFIHSLPVAGVDGTLEKRFKGMAGERKVRAKTGLLTGVVALSGYASRGRGDKIVFAFVFNGGENEAHVRDIFDGLASMMTK